MREVGNLNGQLYQQKRDYEEKIEELEAKKEELEAKVEELDDEVWMEREEAEQREFAVQLAATIAAEIAEVERQEAERDAAEERRQLEMRNLVKRERTV